MEKTDAEVIVPLEGKVTISNEKFKVKQYSIRNIIGASRDILEAINNIKEKNPNLEFKENDMLKYFPLLLNETDKVLDLMALAIGKDGKWLGDQKDLCGLSELFKEICTVNDFGKIIENFQKGWSQLKSQKVTVA